MDGPQKMKPNANAGGLGIPRIVDDRHSLAFDEVRFLQEAGAVTPVGSNLTGELDEPAIDGIELHDWHVGPEPDRLV